MKRHVIQSPDLPLIGPKPSLGGNYADMSPAEQRRVDELFKKYPMQPKEISASVDGKKLMESTSENGKRILTRMVVVHPDSAITKVQLIQFFTKHIEHHAWKMGYEIDYEFPGHLRANKIKKDPFAWFIFAILKKNPYNNRDVFFGTKGMDLRGMAKQVGKPPRIKKDVDFTKL